MRHTVRATASLVPLLVCACLGRIDPDARDEPVPPDYQVPPLVPSIDPDPGYRTPDLYLPPPPPASRTPAPVPPSGPRQPSQPVFDEMAGAAAPAAPVIGGTLLVLRGGKVAVASDPDRNRIFVVDLERGVLIRELVFEPGSEPGRLAQDGSGRVFAALRGGGQLVTLDPVSFALAGRRAVCAAPRGVAALPDGSRVYVGCAGGELVALPAAGGSPLWTRALERDLRDVVLDADGSTLLVTTFRSARVLMTDLEGNRLGELAPPTSLNLTRRSRSGPEGPAATRFTPSVAWRAVAAPGGGLVMLHQRGFTGQIPADPNTGAGNGGYGGSGCSGGLVQTVVSVVGRAGARKPSAELDGSVLMVDAALSDDGRLLAIVGPGSAHVPLIRSVVQVGPLAQVSGPQDDGGCLVALGPISPGRGDADPVWTPEDRSVTQRKALRGEAVAVAFDGQGDLVVQLREPAELVVPRRGLRVQLSVESRAHVGQAIFHADTGGGIACASCHPEGGEDGRVWNFLDLGARRTQSLRGGVSATAPLHWDGDMLDLAQIAHEVFSGRMGGPPLSDAETGALAQWIDSIPLLPSAPPGDAEAVARGRALFQSSETGCAGCHAGPRLTNNLSADVGTGRALQVPSLLGLAARAPYLHDGCAGTLAARFSPSCGGGDRHGVTSTLNSQQAADLQAFLESL